MSPQSPQGPQGHDGQEGRDPSHSNQGHRSKGHDKMTMWKDSNPDKCEDKTKVQKTLPDTGAGTLPRVDGDNDQGQDKKMTGCLKDKTSVINKDKNKVEDKIITKGMKQPMIMFTSTDIRYRNVHLQVPEGLQVTNKVQTRPSKPADDNGTGDKDYKTRGTLTQDLLSTGNAYKHPGVHQIASKKCRQTTIRAHFSLGGGGGVGGGG